MAQITTISKVRNIVNTKNIVGRNKDIDKLWHLKLQKNSNVKFQDMDIDSYMRK